MSQKPDSHWEEKGWKRVGVYWSHPSRPGESCTEPFDMNDATNATDHGREHPESEGCSYVAGSDEPCGVCPKKITALHMCGLLKDGADEVSTVETK